MFRFKGKIMVSTLILCLGLAQNVWSGETQNSDGVCGTGCTWAYDASTKTLTITGTGENVTANKDVVGGWSGLYWTPVENVVVRGVKTLAENSFKDYGHLQNVDLDDTLETIGNSAFANTGLTGVDIPQSVKNIDSWAFANTKMTNVFIPDGVINISEAAFRYNEQLENVVISDTVTGIGNSAFDNCPKLKSVILPDSVTNMGNYVFNSSESLEEIVCQGDVSVCRSKLTWSLQGSAATSDDVTPANENQCNNVSHYWNGTSCVNQPDKSQRTCSSSYKYNDGYCDRIIYTPAEAAQFLRKDNTNFITITFKK